MWIVKYSFDGEWEFSAGQIRCIAGRTLRLPQQMPGRQHNRRFARGFSTIHNMGGVLPHCLAPSRHRETERFTGLKGSRVGGVTRQPPGG